MKHRMRILDGRWYNERRRRILRGVLKPLFRTNNDEQRWRLPASGVRRILVCRPNHRLGNLLLLTPLLQEIEQRLPGAQVDIVAAGSDAEALFAGYANVGRVYRLSRRVVRHIAAAARIIVQIRCVHYDAVIDPSLASQSGRILATVSGSRRLIGFPRASDVAAWDGLDPCHHLPRHAGQLPVFLLRRACGCNTAQLRAPYPSLDIHLSATECADARRTLAGLLRDSEQVSARRVIGVFAEATGDKRYARDWWLQFIAVIRRRYPSAALVEILPPDGRPRLAMDLPTFCSPSPRKVAALIAAMACFVSADCGVMHLASASGTPTLGLFSASDVAKYEPYGRGSCALVTTGKRPDEVAWLASAHIDRLVATASAGCTERNS